MFNEILVPVDLAHIEISSAMIDKAKKIAEQNNARLVLLNVIPDIPTFAAAHVPLEAYQDILTNAQIDLDRLIAFHQLPSTTVARVKQGHPARTIVRAADEMKADLIVIASHQPGLSDYLLGSVAGRVVRHAHCSVLVLR